jgi:hypothetical protein
MFGFISIEGYALFLSSSTEFDHISAAMGTSGQYIIVAPEENLVVVYTSKLTGLDTFLPAKMFKKYFLGAIASDAAIAANEAAYSELVGLSSPADLAIERTTVPELPEMATYVSGVTYQMERNDWRYNNFELVFDPAGDYAELNYTAKDEKEVINMLVGLDNVHRFARTNGQTYAAAGYWSTDDTFTVNYEVIGYSTQDQWNLTFTEEGISVQEMNEITGARAYRGTIR